MSNSVAVRDSKIVRSGTMYLTESLIRQLTKEDDIKAVTHLDIESTRGDRKLATIENLHSLHNLTHLNLRGNNIVRMDGLASLLQLLHLNLADNHIEKIEGFESLAKLTLLDVSGNRIERIPPLKRLGALRILRIAFNRLFRLDDITALKYLISLHHLSVKSNPCCDSADPSGVIVFHLPSLLTLDGQDVTPELRAACQKRFSIDEVERIEGVVRNQESQLAELSSLNASLREQMKGSLVSASKLRDTSDRSRKGNEALQDELSTTRELLEKKSAELAKKELLVSELKHKLATYMHDEGAIACDADALRAQQHLALKRRMLNDMNQLVDTLTVQSSQLLQSLETHEARGSGVSDSSAPASPFSPSKRKPASDAERRAFKNVERLERFEKNYCDRIRQVTEVISSLPHSDDDQSGPAAELRRQKRQLHVLSQDREANLKELMRAQEQLCTLQGLIVPASPSRVEPDAHNSEGVLVFDARRSELQSQLSDVQSQLTQTISQRQNLEDEIRVLQAAAIGQSSVSDIVLNSHPAELMPAAAPVSARPSATSTAPTACESCQTDPVEDPSSSTVKALVGALFRICKEVEVEGNVAAAPDSAANDVCVRFSSLQASNAELLQSNTRLKDMMRQISDSQVDHHATISRMEENLGSAREELGQMALRFSEMESKHKANASRLEAELQSAREEVRSLNAMAKTKQVPKVTADALTHDARSLKSLKRVADALSVACSVKDSPEDVAIAVCAQISSMQDSIVRLREMHRALADSEAAHKLEVSRLEADLETAFQQVSELVATSVVSSKSPARLSNAKHAAMQAAIERIAKDFSIDTSAFDSPDMFATSVCAQYSVVKSSNQRLEAAVAESGRSQMQHPETASALQLELRRHLATTSALQAELQQARQQLAEQATLLTVSLKVDAATQSSGHDHHEALERIAKELFVELGSNASAHDVADAVCSQIQNLTDGSVRLREMLREFADADALQKDDILGLELELQKARDELESSTLAQSHKAPRSPSPEQSESLGRARDITALQRIAQALSFEFSDEADVECVSETVCFEIKSLQESNRALREHHDSATDQLAVQKEVVQRLEAELREHIAQSAQQQAQNEIPSAAGFCDETYVFLDRIAQELDVSRSVSDSVRTFTSVLCAQVILLKQGLSDAHNANSELECAYRDACEKHTLSASALMQAEARIMELEMTAAVPQEVDSDAELQSMLLPPAARHHMESTQLESGIDTNDTPEAHETLIRLLESLHESELRRAQAEDAAAQAVSDKESAIASADQAFQQAEKQRVLLASLQQQVSEMQKAVQISQSQSSQVVVKQFASASAISQTLQDKEDKLRLLNSELEAVEKRMLGRKGELDGVLRELQQADSRRSDIDQAILVGTNQLMELQSQLISNAETFEAERVRIQSTLQSEEETVAGLRDSMQAEAHQLQQTQALLVEKMDELGRLESLTARIPQLQSELQKLTEEADSARRSIQSLEQRRIQVASEIQLLDQEKSSMRAQMDDVRQQLDSSRVELADVKKQVSVEYERARMDLRAKSAHAAVQTSQMRSESLDCATQTFETCDSLDSEYQQMQYMYLAERSLTTKLVTSMSSLFSVFTSFCSFSMDESSSGYSLFSKVEQSAAELHGIVNSISALDSEASDMGLDLPKIESECVSLVEGCQVFLDSVRASMESLSRHITDVRDSEQQFLRQQRVLEECLSVYDTFRAKIGDAEMKHASLEEQNSLLEVELEGSRSRLQDLFQEEHSAQVRMQLNLSELNDVQDRVAHATEALESLNSTAQRQRADLMSIQSQKDDVTRARDVLVQSISTCEVRLRSLEKQHSDLLCELSELGTRVLDLSADVHGLEELKQEEDEQCSALEKRRQEIADSISPLEQQQSDLLCKLSDLGSALSNLNAEVARLEDLKKEGEFSCSLLASKHEELSQSLQLLDDNASARVALLNDEEKRCIMSIGILKAENASEQGIAREISKVKQALEAQVETVRSQLNELHGELADCTVMLQNTKEQQQAENVKLDQIQGSVSSEQQKVAEAKEELYGARVASESLNSQLEALISQLDAKQEEMEVLRRQIGEQSEQLPQQRLLVSQATQNKQKVLLELEDLESRRSLLVADIQNKGHQISSYEEQIGICLSKESALRSSLAAQSASLEKTVSELASVKLAHQELDLNCNMLRRQEIELSARLPAIRIEVEESERELAAVETALSRVRQDFLERDSEVAIRRNQLESMHKEHSSLSSQIEGLHSSVSAERSALSAVQAQVQDHRQQVAELKSVIREKTREADALSSTLVQLQAACAREKEVVNSVTVEAGSLASSKDELRRSLDQLDRRHLQVQIDAQQHQAVIASLVRAKDKAEDMLKRTKEEHEAAILRLDKINLALKDKESSVDSQSNRLEALRAEANECRHDFEAVRTEKQRLESELTQMRHEFKLSERDLLEAKDDLRRVRREVDDSKEHMIQERTRLDAAAKEVRERELKLAQAQATFSIDSAALAAAEESISQLQVLADNFGADVRLDDEVRTSASSLPGMPIFSESWESFPQHISPSKHVRSSSTLSVKLMRLVRVADSYKNSVASSKSQLNDLQSRLTELQLQLSDCLAEESRCKKSVAALKEERAAVLSASAGQLQSFEEQLSEVRNCIQQSRLEEQSLVSTIANLQQRCSDSRHQAERLIAAAEQHAVSEREAVAACESAVRKRLDLEEQMKLIAARHLYILDEKDVLERQLAEMKADHSSLADEMSTIAEMKAALEGSLSEISQFVTTAEQKAHAATSLHSRAAKSIEELQRESDKLKQEVASLNRIKEQLVQSSKQCVSHVETTLSSILQSLQSSLSADAAESIMPKFESMISSVLADFESIYAAVAVVENSNSREQQKSVIEAALQAKVEHYHKQIREAEQRLAGVDRKREEILAQLEEKVTKSGHLVSTNRAEAQLFEAKARDLQLQVEQLDEKLALLSGQVLAENEALAHQEQLRVDVQTECEECLSKLQAERRLCAQLEHTATGLRSRNAAIESEVAASQEHLQQQQLALRTLTQQLEVQQQQVASARHEHDSLRQDVLTLTMGVHDFVSQLSSCNASAGDVMNPAELPCSAPPILQPLLDQLQRMCACFVLTTSRQQLEAEQPLASTSDMLLINTEMADLRLRLQALHAQAQEAEQRWSRAEAAAAAAESRLADSALLQDSANQSALSQILEAKDALVSKLDHQQQHIRDMCSRLRSSLSSLPIESPALPTSSLDGIEQLDSLLGRVENVLLHASLGDAAASPTPRRPHATPLMGGVGASSIASAASTATRFASPLPHKDSEYMSRGGNRHNTARALATDVAAGSAADETMRWLELQLAVCRQEFTAMENRYQHAMESSVSWRSEREELLRSIASLNARLAIAEEGGTLRAAATRDDELKEALRAMERRLEMRQNLGSLASRVKNECISDLRQKLGMVEH